MFCSSVLLAVSHCFAHIATHMELLGSEVTVMRFTDRSVAALKPKADRYEKWEDGRTGLGLRISPKGRKTWVFMYRFTGRARRMTMGTYPAVSLADARVAWGKAKKVLDLGTDPGTIKVADNKAEREAETVSELIETYMTRHGVRKRTGKEDERLLRREIEPSWGRRKAKSITRRDVIAALDKIEDRGAPVLRNRLLSAVQGMFRVALDRGVIDETPCARISRIPEKPRERSMDADEVKMLWLGLDSDGIEMSPAVRLAIKWALATGQRRAMIAGARRDEISEAEDGLLLWEIPAERVKATRESARRPQVVPLSKITIELLRQIDELREMLAAPTKTRKEPLSISPFLFPSARQYRPITPDPITRALRKNLKVLGLENVRPHDFRRTVDTKLGELGFSRFIRDRVLGHVDPSVGGRHYDRYDYLPEKRAALEAWGNVLAEITTGEASPSNVVKLAPSG